MSNALSKKDNNVIVIDKSTQIILSQAAAQAVQAIIETVQTHIKHVDYRNNLNAIIKTIETDQTMRHNDVDKIIEIIDKFKDDFSQDVKDKYYIAILKILESARTKPALPEPPK